MGEFEESYKQKRKAIQRKDTRESMGPRRVILCGRYAMPFVEKMRPFYMSKREELLDDNKNDDEADPVFRGDLLKNLTKAKFDVGDVTWEYFPDGEQFVKIESNVRKKYVDFFHFYKDADRGMMSLFMIADALVRAGIKGFDFYAPYFPYGREDKKDDGRVAITAKLMYKLLYCASQGKLDRMVTMDLHSGQAQGFIDVPVDNLYFKNTFCKYILSNEFKEKHPGEYVTLALDAGSAKKNEKLAVLLGTDLVVLTKTRPEHGVCTVRESDVPVLKGKHAITLDDLISTGGTIVSGANVVKQSGGLSLTVGACHGVLCTKNGITAEEKLKACDNLEVVISDSVPKPEGYFKEHKDFITGLSVSEKFAHALLTNRTAYSMSKLITRNQERLKDAVSGEGPSTNVRKILLT